MPFSIPIRSRPIDDLISVIELWFSDKYQADDDNWPSGMFLVRGGVCWPEEYVPHRQGVFGHILLCGYNLKTDRAFVFESRAFNCIDDILDLSNRVMLFPGLSPWFSEVWSRYVADTFYVSQPDPVRDRWESEVRHCPRIEPPPRFVPCPELGDVDHAEGLLWEWITRQRLAWFKSDPVNIAFRNHDKATAKRLPPELHALACCLSGMSTQIAGARELARTPGACVAKTTNQLMVQHPRDWHTHPEQCG